MPILTLPFPLPGAVTPPVVPVAAPTYTALIGGAYAPIQQTTVSIQNAIGQRGAGAITVKSALGVNWPYGTQALLFDETGTQVYGGYVAHDVAKREHGARQGDLGWLLHDLTLMDNTYRADKRLVFKRYDNVSAGFIVRDLYGSYLVAEGVIITAASVAEGPTIIQAIWNGAKSVADVLTWLAQQSGYWWTIDTDGVLWFQPYGALAAPFALDGTNVDAMQDVTVDYGNDMLANRQFVNGSVAQKGSLASPLVETFKGDGARRSFTLGYPLNTLVSVTLDALDITTLFQDKGSSGGAYYKQVGDPVLTQDPSQSVLTSSDTLVVTYIGQYPVRAMAQDSAQIAAQALRERVGSGIIETVYSDTKLRSLPAAFQVASGRLVHYSADATLLTFYTKEPGLMPGQLLQVSLSDFGLSNLPMLIIAVNISDAQDGHTIWFQVAAVGAPDAATWSIENAQWPTFWQNLMAQSSDPSDYTDAQDTSLALFADSVALRTPTVTITTTKAVCPIFSNTTLFGDSTVFC
jgi:hypothetical protein